MRGPHGQQATDLDRHGRLAQHPLHALAVLELAAEALALPDVVGRDAERPLGHAQPAHAMGETCGAQADLRDLEPVADIQQPVFVGDLQPVETQLAMAAVFLRAHDRDPSDDFPARLVAVEEEGRQPLAGIVRCPRHQDEVLGDAGPGDEPLAATDQPAVAPGLGIGLHGRGVGAGPRRRLGHGERRPDRAVDDGLQPAGLLRFGADLFQQDHVAVVRRGTVEDDRAEDRVAHLLVAARHAGNVQAAAAPGFGHLQGPEALALRLVPKAFQQVEADVLMLVIGFRIGFQRHDLFGDEVPDLEAQGLDLRREMEIHVAVILPIPKPGCVRSRVYPSPPEPSAIRSTAATGLPIARRRR